METGNGEAKTGYFKVAGCCRQAVLDSLGFAWVDSCCIDKSSSAELSEAINSMFKWYCEARVWYIYLSYAPTNSQPEDLWPTGSWFRQSQWFTRGWTLQELLAPVTAIFFDHKWSEIGTKLGLKNLIEEITGI
jgi:hypothetical protein